MTTGLGLGIAIGFTIGLIAIGWLALALTTGLGFLLTIGLWFPLTIAAY